MSLGTLMPSPWMTFVDGSGAPYAGALLFTYASGTTTKQTTYSDAAMSSANTNPIVLDSAGRCVVFLDTTKTWKFVLAPSTDTDPPTSPIKTGDVVTAVPPIAQRLTTDTTDYANSLGALTDLASYSIPAGTLGTNGQIIRVTAAGYFAANGNNKLVNLVFGSETLAAIGSGAYNGVRWRVTANIVRVSAVAGQIAEVLSFVGGGSYGLAGTGALATATEDCTGAITVKMQGQGTADSDIVQQIFVVEYLP